MSGTLFIHAVNIHQGGGERLLKALLSIVDPQRRTVLNVDSRMSLPDSLPRTVEVRRVDRSVKARIMVELWLYRQANAGDYVICFGNLPPLFQLKAFTSVFVQNRYLIDSISLRGLKIWPRLRIKIERIWLRLTMNHTNQFIVQTPSMRLLMNSVVKNSVKIVTAPFSETVIGSVTEAVNDLREKLPNFIYVASGEEHKNHRRLLQAWCQLAAEGIRPLLVLTVNPGTFPELCTWMEELIEANRLNVINIGTVTNARIGELYLQSDVLIYPSQLESFGLPLLEASAAGLDIVAAELDYVRDVVRPVQSFDPASALSIARAVKRYCGQHDPALQLLSPAQFMNVCLRREGDANTDRDPVFLA